MVFPRLMFVLTAALLAAAPVAASDLQRLVDNSPFAPVGASGSAATGAPLEFRGVFMDQGEYFFSIYNPATKFSTWVGLDEPGQEFVVRSYDEGAQTIVAAFKGGNLTLRLGKAPAVAATSPAAMPAPPASTGSAATATVTAPENTEAKRLADLAAEIRRRRALRQQGLPPPGTAAAPPSNHNP